MLMFATAGLIRCAVIQSTAAMRSDICPPPEQGSTRTEWTKAFFRDAISCPGCDRGNMGAMATAVQSILAIVQNI